MTETTMTATGAPETRSEIRDGMRVDWHVRIPMDDGIEMVADVFRPTDEGRFPAIISYGPYAKGLAFQDGYPEQWEKMVSDFPEVAAGSTNQYQNWEVVDPEKWVPHGYVCVRVDSRGTGMSPGFLDIWSPREAQDIYECIEWTARQAWSDGKVGMSGISYYAMNQYQVAALQPPHLTCILPWEGASDWYRELSHHGGILSGFGAKWYPLQVSSVQHGVGERGARSRVTGEPVAGTVTLSEEELARARADFVEDIKSRPLMDPWYLERKPNWSKVQVPMLSAGNWGGQNLHLRGNVEAYVNAASEQKWLEIHGIAHWTHYYTDYGISLQRRFLDHFLKGVDSGWDEQAPVILQVRHIPERYVERHEQEWPLARTQWTKLYLDIDGLALSPTPLATGASVRYDPLGEGLTFRTAPLTRVMEITGPMAARLHVASQSQDADLFVVVRVFDPEGQEVTFQGALDPNTPISQGWLRASHRRLDETESEPYRPYHPHDAVEPLAPGDVYPLDIEIWPSCIVIPAGYTLGFSVRGNDYRYEGELSDFAKTFRFANRGVGPFTHADPDDRPEDVFGAPVTLFAGGVNDSYVLLPVIPATDESG